jgi:Fe-S cluster biosynthesis and repair protein YggX
MIARCQDKSQLQDIFRAIHKKGWISCSELKRILAEEFDKRLIKSIKPVATLIEQCQLYFVEKKSKKIDGKLTRGYELGNFKFTLL